MRTESNVKGLLSSPASMSEHHFGKEKLFVSFRFDFFSEKKNSAAL